MQNSFARLLLLLTGALLACLSLGQSSAYIVPPSNSVAVGQETTCAHTNYLISAFPHVMPWHGGASPEGPAVGGVSGLHPTDLFNAYGMPTSSHKGQGAIAIIDAYDYANALSDFNTFSTNFGLATETSSDVTSSSNTVFQVVYENNTKPADGASNGWNGEEALDIEWAHAMAPNAKIYLFEATNNNTSNLFACVLLAKAKSDVQEISMSFGSSEFASEVNADSFYFGSVTSAVCFAASGDTGGAQQYPAESPDVVGVGGTKLNFDISGNLTSETAWGVSTSGQSGSGGGPSAYESRPSFQDIISGTVGTKRGCPDVSADADPNSGVAVYCSPQGGWQVIGGTSLACPLVAGMTNCRGSFNTSTSSELTAIYSYYYGASFYRDITSGHAGTFSAASGWDYITGIGSPTGPDVMTVTLDNSSVVGGTLAHGTLHLNFAAGSGVTYTVASNSSAASVPSGSQSITSGSQTATFYINTHVVETARVITLNDT